MATYPGAKQISVRFEGDPPRVTNSVGEADTIPASNTAVEWSAWGSARTDALTITGITFYTDASKTQTYSPPFFGRGFNFGNNNWVLPFVAGVAVPAEVDLIYTLSFKEGAYNGVPWDPTLKISPRNASQGAGG